MIAQRETVAVGPQGLHLRPAADFVRRANTYRADITVVNLTRGLDRRASGRSLLQITALGVDQGHRVRIEAEGDDAEQAVAALAEMIERP